MENRNLWGDRWPQLVALGGGLLQVLLLGILVSLSLWKDSEAIAALARFVAAGIPVWLILFLVFKQLRRVAHEQLETTELKRAQVAGEALFEVEDEALLLEQNRLRWMIRWLVPSITVIVFLYLAAGHFIGWRWSFDSAFTKDGIQRTTDPKMMMWFIVGIGLVSFLFASYTITLSRIAAWRLLHGGAMFMAGTAVACLALAIALMAGTTFSWAEPLYLYVVRVGLLLLGVELAANFILDFYRPRTPGTLPRPSFDSRLLGLIGEPGGIAKSIADAINYQFGFEVSSTWFYKLLQKWFLVMAAFTILVLWLFSSVVIVQASEEVVIERWGSLLPDRSQPLGPGLHFKLPFPIETVHRAPVKQIRELVIGESTANEEHHEEAAIVWTETHDFVPEMLLMVASPRLTDLSTTGAPVSLLMISVPIEYRIKDLKKYLYVYDQPEQLLESIVFQFLSDTAAGMDIDLLMGPGREEINRILKARLQEKLDVLDIGIEIVFAGIRSAHPPARDGVAESFLRVITAETQGIATIRAAEGEAQRILTAVAGTEERALSLNDSIRRWERLRADPDSAAEALATAQSEVDELLLGDEEKRIPPLSGDAAARIADARTRASRLIGEAATKVRAFKTEVVAYQAAPELYCQRKILGIWNGLETVRKYLIVGDPKSVIIEYETEQPGGLDTVFTDTEKPAAKKPGG